MKILFFINGIYLGGKERRLVELMKELKSKTQFEFELVAMNPEINYREIFDLNIKLHFLIRTKKKDLSVFNKLYLLSKRFRPDIIHCWDSMTAVYAIPACKLLNIKLVNGMIVDVPQQRNIKNKNWLRAKLSFPFSDLIVGNSKAGLMAYGAPSSKSVCIYNGFNFSRIENLKEKEKIIAELHITTPYVIGMVATHSHYKDYKTYFRAAEILLAIRKDVTFLAIGNQTDSVQAKSLISGALANHVRLLGKQADVESYIQLMDICVLATFTEGISNSILEYMAMSKPVVATSGGGTNEIVVDNRTGFLIPQSDPTILAEKLDALLNNAYLRKQFGMEGKLRVQNHFVIKPMVDSYISHYNRLLNIPLRKKYSNQLIK